MLAPLAHARLRADDQTLDGVPVLVTAALGPAAIGVRHPRIIVPRWLFDLDEPLRAFVLHHEQEHCRARDPRTMLGAALATALFPWNPALWWITRRLHLALKEDCDARVLSSGASIDRYGKLLMLIAHRQSMTRLAPVLAASNSHLERRILAMRAPRPTHPVFHLIAFAGIALAAARIQGSVIAQFVVNANGTVDTATFKVLKSSTPDFTAAVRQVLPSWRYAPARADNGAPVRQVVQQPFMFKAKMAWTRNEGENALRLKLMGHTTPPLRERPGPSVRV